jgi:hypothetical protein
MQADAEWTQKGDQTMSIVDELAFQQPGPNTLDAFLLQREGQFHIKTLHQEVRSIGSDSSTSQELVSLAELSYQGRVITREVSEPYLLEEQRRGGTPVFKAAFREREPNIYSFLVDLLQGIRELEVLTRSRDEWRDIYGPSEDGDEGDRAFVQHQQSIRDAHTLLGEEYSEFAQIIDYDENFLWLAGKSALIALQDGLSQGEEVTVIRWHKREGDECAKGESVVQVQAKEHCIDVVTEAPGTLYRIVAVAGVALPVGTILGYMELDEDWGGDELVEA